MRSSEELDKVRYLCSVNDPHGALVLCAPILKADPANIEARYFTAKAYLALGRTLEAFAQIAPACKLAPDRVDLHLLLLSCLLAGGSVTAAGRIANRTLSLGSSDPEVVRVSRMITTRLAEKRELLGAMPRVLIDEPVRSAITDPSKGYRFIPIIINSRDRLSTLERLVNWLRSAGYQNLAVLDNCSSYPPLLNYLDRIQSELLVYRLKRNLGSQALWMSGLFETFPEDIPFVYTDSDILPIEGCPADVVIHLHELLCRYPQASKAGLGLRIDDIPNTYKYRTAVIDWESKFWEHPLAGNCYSAPVDTTFAVYRPASWHQLNAVRSGYPYLARHLPWYEDTSRPTDEENYYRSHALASSSSWSAEFVAARYLT